VFTADSPAILDAGIQSKQVPQFSPETSSLCSQLELRAGGGTDDPPAGAVSYKMRIQFTLDYCDCLVSQRLCVSRFKPFVKGRPFVDLPTRMVPWQHRDAVISISVV